jgi:hypothetical protein
MLRSLLCLLLDKISQLMDSFLPIFRDKRRLQGLGFQWHDGELKDFFLTITSHSNLPPIILVADALDECTEAEVRSVVGLLEDLGSKAASSPHSIRICLSSRHYPSISMARNLELVVETQPEHRKDIAIYIQDKLKDKEGHDVEKLEMMAEGIFMWIIMVIEIINRDFDEGVTTNIETTFSSSLDDVFLTLLEKNNRRKDQTVLMLQWVLFARVPLSPAKLYFAVIAGTNKDGLQKRPLPDSSKYAKFITTTSRGLVELQPSTKSIETQFIHESVRDFLMGSKRLQLLDPQLGSHTVAVSHDRLVDCCLSYIDMIPYEDIHEHVDDSMLVSYPFLNYVPFALLWHAERACRRPLTLEPRLHRLLDQDTLLLKLKRLIRDFYKAGDIGDDAVLLYILCWCVSTASVRALLHLRKDRIDVNSQNGGRGTALHVTIKGVSHAKHPQISSDLCQIATMLIGAGADISATQAMELERGRQKLLRMSWSSSEDESSEDDPK